MLDNLRSMAIFASVVKHGSFSGTAKELNITTSAVSQQIRSLESDLGTVLLHRSTRKISLTEAGEVFYQSAVKMVSAAQLGWYQVNRLRDEVMGNLTVATTPAIMNHHLMPVLSDWLDENPSLSLNFLLREEEGDLTHDRVDIYAGLIPQQVAEPDDQHLVLDQVPQVMLATPEYLSLHAKISDVADLANHEFILIGDDTILDFSHHAPIKMRGRLNTNNSKMALDLALSHHGMIKINALDADAAISSGQLLPVLDEFELPKLSLIVKTPVKDFQPIKVQKCLDILTHHFHRQPEGV